VVTGHVVLGMMILGAGVVLSIVSGVLASPVSDPAVPSRTDQIRERAFA